MSALKIESLRSDWANDNLFPSKIQNKPSPNQNRTALQEKLYRVKQSDSKVSMGKFEKGNKS